MSKKIKTVPTVARDVETLSSAERKELMAFRHSPAFRILQKLALDAKQNVAMESMELTLGSTSDIALFQVHKGMMRGVDFIMDACERAKDLEEKKGNLDPDE